VAVAINTAIRDQDDPIHPKPNWRGPRRSP
jgi:hypothetical protein